MLKYIRDLFRTSLLLLLLLFSGLATSQSAEVLRSKRNRLLKDLEKTNRELAETRERKGAAVGQADLLRDQIEQRRELIATLREEIHRNASRMRRDSGVIIALNDDLDRMRTEYGQALIVANRARLSQGWLGFLLSADGFNDAFRRLAYLRQYRTHRKQQNLVIRRTRSALNDRYERLTFQRFEQDSLLLAAGNQGTTLEQELADQTQLVERLSNSEKGLLQRIRRQRKEQEELNRSVERAIVNSIKEEEERKKEVVPERSLVGGSGASITARRGRLAWPVSGEVVRPFGEQPHPDVPSVRIKNSGIDISVSGGTQVEAIYAGEVISVRTIPGYRNTVMIRHGDHYTVYSNLDAPTVTRGQQVDAGTPLGSSVADAPVHFELWRGRTPQDPQRWLVRK